MARLRRVTKAEIEASGGMAFVLPNGDYVMLKESDEAERQDILGKTLQDKFAETLGQGQGNIDSALICKICTKLFSQPMTTPCCGSTYCEACIISEIERTGKCFSCQKNLMAHTIVPNQAVKRQVDELTKERNNPVTGMAGKSGKPKEVNSVGGLLSADLINKVNQGLGGGDVLTPGSSPSPSPPG